MTRALVTGGSGFLGQHLVPELRARGWDVLAPRRAEADLAVAGSLDHVPGRFDVVFHLAAWTQAGDWCLTHPGEQWIVNQQINTNVLAWWRAHQPQAYMVAMGTSCSYAPGEALVEDNYLVGDPIDSLYTYAMTKRMLLQGLRAIEHQYGQKHLYPVPSTLYGPGYHTDGRQMHFIFDLIRKILRGRDLGEPVVLWGDGTQRRELVHVQDFVSDLITLADRRVGGVVNLGAGEDHEIREFARIICEIVGYDPDLVLYDTDRYVGARSKVLDVTKASALLPERTGRPLRQGLAETIAWFEAAGLPS